MRAKRNPAIAELPVTFQANDDHVVAIFEFDNNHTIGIRFTSPGMMLAFCVGVIEKAAEVWPDDEFIKKWQEEP